MGEHPVLEGDGTLRSVSCDEFQRYVEQASWYARATDLQSRVEELEVALGRILDTELDRSLEWTLAPATFADTEIPWQDVQLRLLAAMREARLLTTTEETREDR